MKLFMLAVTILFQIKSFAQDACPRQCDTVEVKKICFVAEETWNEKMGLMAHATRMNCIGRDIYRVESLDEVKQILQGLAESCVSISKLKFFGHGNKFGHEAMFTKFSKLEENYEGFECLFEDRAEIELDGCNTGSSCAGQALMFTVARTFLKTAGGTVWGNNTLASGFAVTPHISLDFTSRRVSYTPHGGQYGVTSELRGLTEIWEDDEPCKDEFLETLKKFKEVYIKTSAHCLSKEDLKPHQRQTLKKLKKWYKNKYTENIVDIDESVGLQTTAIYISFLEGKIERLEKCQSELEGSLLDDVTDFIGIGQ